MLSPQRDYDNLAKDAIFDSIQLVFGLTDADAERFIRYSWPTPDGSVKFDGDPTVDVCYVRYTYNALESEGYVNDSVSEVTTQSGTVGVERMDTHRGIRAALIFYGPHSPEYATRVRVGMNRSDVSAILATADMSYVSNRQMPVSMDELIDGNWFSRTDVSIDFYQLVVYTGTVSLIGQAPDIHIKYNS